MPLSRNEQQSDGRDGRRRRRQGRRQNQPKRRSLRLRIHDETRVFARFRMTRDERVCVSATIEGRRTINNRPSTDELTVHSRTDQPASGGGMAVFFEPR